MNSDLEDTLKPFRDFADAVIDLFRKELKQDDYTLAGPGAGE